MPTFRNNTDHAIMYDADGRLYNFPAKTDYASTVWLPYQELGLELVNADYPPVPSKILTSGKFRFNSGTERKINMTVCKSYRLSVKVKSGRLKLYFGSAATGAEISDKYETILEWGYAPYIRLVGIEDNTEADIHAEIEER